MKRLRTPEERPIKQLKTRTFAVNLAVVAIFVVATIVLGAYSGIVAYAEREAFAENVVVDGYELGGLTYEEAKTLVLGAQEEKLSGVQIRMEFNGQKHTFNAAELGVVGNAEEVLDAAYSYNKQGKTLSENFENSFDEINLQTEIKIDPQVMTYNVTAFLLNNGVEAVDASAQFNETTGQFTYTDSREGVTADIEKVCEDVEAQVLAGDYSPVVVEAVVVEPEFSTEVLRQNTTLIGTKETEVAANGARETNIELVCEQLNGLQIMPGETLSVNDVVGPRTEEKGYVPASTIADGKLSKEEIGGGIAQVAGTLYNAALFADIEIVERSRSSWPAAYLPVGLDCSISWDDKDLKLKNKTEFPIYISTRFSNGFVIVEVYGAPSEYTVDIQATVLKETPEPTPEMKYSHDYPAGQRVVDIEGKKGYEVEVMRHYLQNEITVRSELISDDYYPEVREVIIEGTAEK